MVEPAYQTRSDTRIPTNSGRDRRHVVDRRAHRRRSRHGCIRRAPRASTRCRARRLRRDPKCRTRGRHRLAARDPVAHHRDSGTRALRLLAQVAAAADRPLDRTGRRRARHQLRRPADACRGGRHRARRRVPARPASRVGRVASVRGLAAGRHRARRNRARLQRHRGRRGAHPVQDSRGTRRADLSRHRGVRRDDDTANRFGDPEAGRRTPVPRATSSRWARWSRARTCLGSFRPSIALPTVTRRCVSSWPAPTAGGPPPSTPPSTRLAIAIADRAARLRRRRCPSSTSSPVRVVLAYPSLDEGFGHPPLEAMRAGVPVVGARAGSLPEVLGDAALLVDPTSVPALADALTAVLERFVDRRRGSSPPVPHAPIATRGRAQPTSSSSSTAACTEGLWPRA